MTCNRLSACDVNPTWALWASMPSRWVCTKGQLCSDLAPEIVFHAVYTMRVSCPVSASQRTLLTASGKDVYTPSELSAAAAMRRWLSLLRCSLCPGGTTRSRELPWPKILNMVIARVVPGKDA